MSEAFITPQLVRWARQRQRLSIEAAAQRIQIKPERLNSWETGIARPTFRQARDLAHKLNIPFGYLFLSAPPAQKLPLPDLRTLANEPPREPSPELFDLLNDVLRKQQWHREYLEDEEAQPLPFIGRYSLSDAPNEVAADIRNTLGINDVMRQGCQNWEQFLQEFTRRAERAGALVLRSSVVGNNTHRKLSVDEFRGFVISDKLAPLVFINAQDWKAAQIFTLAHELAHLWIGESGISNPDYMRRPSQQQNQVERLCDQVAAEILVPNDDFLSQWQDTTTVRSNLQTLAQRYRVSAFVVLRRAYENDKVSFDQYRAYYQELIANVTPKGTQGGGDFYRNLLVRNSNTLTRTLLAAAFGEQLSFREAARLLNVKVKTLHDLRNWFLAGGRANA